jgi:hypothetical protein
MPMPTQTEFDYARPYDLMVGLWSGVSTSYTPDGEYILSVPSLVAIYWKKRSRVLHYRQDELPNLDGTLMATHPNRAAVTKILHHSFDLDIRGKSCVSTAGSHDDVRVAGTETRPGIYLFHLTFAEGHYYNNQYFANPNERHIIGPFIAADRQTRRGGRGGAVGGEIAVVVAQTFTRISYDVPSRFKRPISRAT